MTMQRLDYKDLLIMQMLRQGNPSITEMKQAILARSTGTVAHRLEKLQDAGLVTQPAKNQPRSRKVTSAGEQALAEAGLYDGKSKV